MSGPPPPPESFAPSSSSGSSLSPAAIRQRQRSLTRSSAAAAADALSTPAASRTSRPAPPPLPTSSSPHCTTSLRSRHSLYGTEDRVILDLGSRIWKIGFSGEGSPRECRQIPSPSLWGLEKGEIEEDEWEVREARLKEGLREVWFETLMTDPKTRKVVVVENVWLTERVKEMIGKVLFENLQVPSISFASSGLLSLMATGNVTGLVIDCGNLETTILPIYSSRPLYPHLLSTPRAGSRLTTRLKSLLHHFGLFIPPPPSLNTIPSHAGLVKKGVPLELLTDELVEEIKNRVLFVGEMSDEDVVNREGEDREETGWLEEKEGEYEEVLDLKLMESLEKKYRESAHGTTDVPFKLDGGVVGGVGKGWILVPGWVRERAAEVWWENGNEDERSLKELVLDCLMKVPIDLRRTLASSILLTGGSCMLPGFFPRFLSELLSTLSQPLPSPPPSPLKRPRSFLRRSHPYPYSSLSPLLPVISILNYPSNSPPPAFNHILLPPSSGTAPNFAPSLLPWVGGSLAGALKTGGEEVGREKWEEAAVGGGEMEVEEEGGGGKKRKWKIPDWTTGRLALAV